MTQKHVYTISPPEKSVHLFSFRNNSATDCFHTKAFLCAWYYTAFGTGCCVTQPSTLCGIVK